MASLEESAAARERADFELAGPTPRAPQASARILVRVAQIEGTEPDQWVIDVAEGRLPA